MFKRDTNEQGFSLIEIIATLLVLGVLAAIAIPIYTNQQSQAHQNAVKSDISHTLTALSMQKLDGKFATTLPTDSVRSSGVTVRVRTTSNRLSTCVDGYHVNTPTKVWSINSVDKIVKEQPCA